MCGTYLRVPTFLKELCSGGFNIMFASAAAFPGTAAVSAALFKRANGTPALPAKADSKPSSGGRAAGSLRGHAIFFSGGTRPITLFRV